MRSVSPLHGSPLGKNTWKPHHSCRAQWQENIWHFLFHTSYFLSEEHFRWWCQRRRAEGAKGSLLLPLTPPSSIRLIVLVSILYKYFLVLFVPIEPFVCLSFSRLQKIFLPRQMAKCCNLLGSSRFLFLFPSDNPPLAALTPLCSLSNVSCNSCIWL